MATLDLLDELFGGTAATGGGLGSGLDGGRGSGTSSMAGARLTPPIRGSFTMNSSSVPGAQSASTPPLSSQSPTLSSDECFWSLLRHGRLYEARALADRLPLTQESRRHAAALQRHRMVDDQLELAITDRDRLRAVEQRLRLLDVLAALTDAYPHVTSLPFLDTDRVGPRTILLRRIVEEHGAAEPSSLNSVVSTTTDAVRQLAASHASSPTELLLLASLTELNRGLLQLCTTTTIAEDQPTTSRGQRPESPRLARLAGDGNRVVAAAAAPGTAKVLLQAEATWSQLVTAGSVRATAFLAGLTVLLCVARSCVAVVPTVNVKASGSLVCSEAYALLDAVVTHLEGHCGCLHAAAVRRQWQATLGRSRVGGAKGAECALSGLPLDAPAASVPPGLPLLHQAVWVEYGTGVAYQEALGASRAPVSAVVLNLWKQHAAPRDPATPFPPRELFVPRSA